MEAESGCSQWGGGDVDRGILTLHWRVLWALGIMETNVMSAGEPVDVQLRQASVDTEGIGREGGTGWIWPEPGGLWIPGLTASSGLSGERTLTSLASVFPHPPPHTKKSIRCCEARVSAGLSIRPGTGHGSGGPAGYRYICPYYYVTDLTVGDLRGHSISRKQERNASKKLTE